MKILFVAHSSEFNGGANRSLISIIRHMKDLKKYDIEVLLPKERGKMNDELDRLNIKWRYEKYNLIITKDVSTASRPLRILNLYYKFLKDILKSITLIKKFKKDKYDIIYSNTRVVFLGAFLAKLLKIPHVWHVREFITENNMMTVVNAEKIMVNLSKYIIVISEAVQKSFSSKVNLHKIKLIYNGIEILEGMQEDKREKKGFNLLIAGTIIPAKGQLDAVLAMKEIQKRGYCDVNLYIVGGDPEKRISHSYKSKIIETIEQEKIENVFFEGETEHLNKFRTQMDVELMCSSNEAFGRVTVEGMLNKLLLIGANSGATPEIIKHYQTGLLYETGNINDLTSKIIFAYNNPEKINSIRRQAYEHAIHNFNSLISVTKIEELISTLDNKKYEEKRL